MSKSQSKRPPGWDEERIRKVIAHYENQTEDEDLAELESAREGPGVTMVAVPTEFVPEVLALLARYEGSESLNIEHLAVGLRTR